MADRLAEIRARRGLITSPPWLTHQAGHPSALLVLGGPGASLIAAAIAGAGLSFSDMRANAEFLAHAPEDIDYLLAENEMLRHHWKITAERFAMRHHAEEHQGIRWADCLTTYCVEARRALATRDA